ncbi:Tn3 family transposase [Streptomyces chattanoogensis]|uniref:Tn3 family transposase n=1 Tax=Streptomyces chattanoogensis TaxID=66876 RepID=UPI001B80B5EC|nr:Tn3 family transposase [Streptomyces chattanoogensis]
MRFNALLTNAVIFRNVLDIAEIVRQLLEEGWEIDPEDLAHISPYLTEHINRFGQVQHPPTRHPARGVRPETRRRLHPAARAGPDRRRSRPGA